MEFQKDTNLQRKTKSANKKIVLLKKQQLVVSSSSVSSRSSIRSIPSLKSSRQTRILRNVQSKLQLEPNVAKTPSSQSCDHHKSDIKIHEKSTLPANVRTRTQTQATSKSEPQVRGLEELTRCSSVNNLGTDSKSKGAFSKLRKSASKDKLDKLTDTKNVKELSNNNKLNPAEGEETLEVGILQKQLNKMAKEKSDLMLELDDHKEELKVLKDEIVKLRLLEGEHATDSPECDNVSEVSVTCLQDKINKMQETNYSTNEELQATLQELSDLQSQLTELQQSNERLLDEKNLMFESLCRQTERLNDARAEVESVKQLLCREKEEGNADREKKLITLLKSTQAERETLLFKREQLSNELLEVHATNLEQDAQLEQLNERVRTMESALDAKNAEYKLLNQDLMVAKDLCSARQIEINRLTDLLENARTKINELEQERALNDKSELDELLHSVRKEKCELESEVSNLKEEIAWSINEGDKLREQLSVLQEEYTVTQKNAKCTLSEFEYKYEKLMAEKSKIKEQLLQLQEVVNELQVQNQCLLESKRQLSNDLSDIQRKNNELQVEIDHLKKIRNDETEEWLAFQNDLLTSVKVANDIKSEVQQQLQETIAENISHYNRIQELENQIDRLKDLEEVKRKDQNQDQSFFGKLKFSYYGQNKKSRSMDNIYLNEGDSVKVSKLSHLNKTDINFETLEDLYARIDFNKFEEEFTNEEKFVIKLKHSLDEMGRKSTLKKVCLKQKPRISEPVFTSVFANQKLMSVLSDPTIKTVYEMAGSGRSSADGSSNLDDFLDTVFKLPQPTFTVRRRYFDDVSLDLRSKLNDDEIDLVERILENSKHSRPTSDINEDDLRIIEFARDQVADNSRPVPFPRCNKNLVDCANINTTDMLELSSNSDAQLMNFDEAKDVCEIGTQITYCTIVPLHSDDAHSSSNDHAELNSETKKQTETMFVFEELDNTDKIDVNKSSKKSLKTMEINPVSVSSSSDSNTPSDLSVSDSQSAFQNVRRKFERLIQAKNSRKDEMKHSSKKFPK